MKPYIKQIPAIHKLQKEKRFHDFISLNKLHEKKATEIVGKMVAEARELILTDRWTGPAPGNSSFTDEIFNMCQAYVNTHYAYRLRRVVNATGTILHTNLGRARLSEAAIEHMADVARHYSNLEYSIPKGSRGSRHDLVEDWINELTGAEASMVVNNNAAAVYLILNALAKEQEVIVSRGQLIEIGGSFRVSSIMEESGAILVEVGTTNKTHPYDYENAISGQTGMIMKVHSSNFKMIGFTEEVGREELARISRQNGLVFYEDLGSGVLTDFSDQNIGEEPVVRQVLEQGCDLVSFSGDKLLGGPQAGIIAGKKAWIDKLKKSQLARVLRVDKITLAALEATLLDYLKSSRDETAIPTVQSIRAEYSDLLPRAKDLQLLIRQSLPTAEADIIKVDSAIGGGTMPGVVRESPAVAVSFKTMQVSEAEELLRTHTPPVVARVQHNTLIFDVRTLDDSDLQIIAEALLLCK
ncbi:L-seryl-tRNA(Sec) selenium transferase [Bacillus testis]|uniref:L-seryl-tRNA(Sec) selenium transferase n=1 Tax=Bacillus testis TaxID=1622072 RepID=UPI00067ED2E4|nr:L-seryl-tRNA(Sec) selenium transferase [Bacillus testis]